MAQESAGRETADDRLFHVCEIPTALHWWNWLRARRCGAWPSLMVANIYTLKPDANNYRHPATINEE